MIGTLIDHFRIDEMIGKGGMGTVYLAWDTRLQRSVALKLMHPQIASQPEFQQRLLMEAQAAAQLAGHPSIVNIYDFDKAADGKLYIVMEYIPDGSLHAHLKRYKEQGRAMDLGLVLQVGAQIADALHFAHQRNIVHRDVKPGNIILRQMEKPPETGFRPFRAILTDFGLVQLLNDQHLTQVGVAMGTPIYMSPEQCEGGILDGRADLYALGTVMYELLTGQPPFKFAALNDAVAVHRQGEQPQSLRSIRPDVPQDVEDAIMKALSKSPDARYATGQAMGDVLRTVLAQTQPSMSAPPEQTVYAGDNRIDTPQQGYELLIETEGRDGEHRYALNQVRYTIGRGEDNDFVLRSLTISRQHAVLEFDSAQYTWLVRPLTTTNAVQLNGRPLIYNQLTPIRPGDRVQLGAYTLSLASAGTVTQIDPQAGEITRLDSEQTVQFVPPVPVQPEPEPEIEVVEPEIEIEPEEEPENPTIVSNLQSRYTITIDPEEIELVPGEPQTVKAIIQNETTAEDRINLRVTGLRDEWAQFDAKTHTLEPSGTKIIDIKFDPPREVNVKPGEKPYRVHVVSQNYEDATATTRGNLIIKPFEALAASLQQSVLNDLESPLELNLQNNGNEAVDLEVLLQESEDLRSVQVPRKVTLDPGGKATIEIPAEWKRKRRRKDDLPHIPFEVVVNSLTNQGSVLQTLNGRVTPPGLGLLRWLFYGVLIAIVIALALLASSCAPRLGVLSGLLGDGSTPTPQLVLPTVTPVKAAVPTLNITANDSDGDGLRDDVEQQLGTNPNNIDTDGDGLSDRDEVNVRFTDPLRPDTDGDGVSDGREVNTGTDPTDGSSFTSDDAPPPTVAIASTAAPLPTQMAQSTAEPPTNTPLPTYTPLPTNTPLPSQTPLPSSTPTNTPIPAIIPTDQPTDEPTSVPTDTPTTIPTEQPTDQPTDMPTDTPQPTETDVPTDTPEPTATVTELPTDTPEPTPTDIPTDTPTPTTTPTVPPTDTPTPTETVTPTVTPTITPTIASTASPTPTITSTPTVSPTVTPIVTPTITPLQTATPTETIAADPTLLPMPIIITETVPPLPLLCRSDDLMIDGIMDEPVWDTMTPITITGTPELVVVEFYRTADTFYLGVGVIDSNSAVEGSDNINFFFDVNGNGGDPDAADKRYKLSAVGFGRSVGQGTNSDGASWSSDLSGQFEVQQKIVSPQPPYAWTAEIALDIATEMPDLDQPLRIMIEANYERGAVDVWPDGAQQMDSVTWFLFDGTDDPSECAGI